MRQAFRGACHHHGEKEVLTSRLLGGEGKGKVYAGNEHKGFFHLSRLGQPSPDAHRTRPGGAGPPPAQPRGRTWSWARLPQPRGEEPPGLTPLLIGLS